MGYNTDFEGSFKLNKPLTVAQKAYLEKFCETRRMKRDAAITAKRPDLVREAVGLPVGSEGEFFVGAGGDFGQEGMGCFGGGDADALGIIESNCPPLTQPSLWCHWTASESGEEIIWDGGEKFYDYVEWLRYIIRNFLIPWGLVLNGDVEYFGEDRDDRGIIRVKDNVVRQTVARIVYDNE